jgi:hypothetical protein
MSKILEQGTPLVRVTVALFLVLLSAACTSTRAARPAELYARARAMLAEVKDAPALVETVHSDPRVLSALAVFLQAADAENLTPEQMQARLNPLVPVPPWEWAPGIDVHKIRSGLYLVAVGQAVSGTPSSLYVFDGPRYVKIESGAGGFVQVIDVVAEGNRIDVVYYPTSGTMPVLTSARLEKRAGAWRVDLDTPYRRVTALLERFSYGEVMDPNVYRHPGLLQAVGVFLESAERLSDQDRMDHLSALFPPLWRHVTPTIYIRRIGPTLYLTGLQSRVPTADSGGLYLFDGASHVSLASDDASWISLENVAVDGRRVTVNYRRGGPFTPYRRESVVAERDGTAWRIVPSR